MTQYKFLYQPTLNLRSYSETENVLIVIYYCQDITCAKFYVLFCFVYVGFGLLYGCWWVPLAMPSLKR